ncbi:hypothetical protein CHUAL_007879 [Chamberlinius hualienensis]
MVGNLDYSGKRGRSADKNDMDNRLEKEVMGLNILKESLQKSSLLTKGMNGILTSFEDRLAKLEETILPVYQDTSNLQRKQDNIEQTLKELDHVISYYNVHRELDQTIRDGPTAPLEEYLDCLAKVQDSIAYFEVNNPQSNELHALQSLFKIGGDALEKEFRSLMNRHCKPIPPVMIMDMIGISDEDVSVEDRGCLEQLPEKATKDLVDIANWLVKNQRLDYINVYAAIRSNILVRSIQGWKDYQKSCSGGCIVNTSAVFNSPALSKNRVKDTPSRKASKKFQQLLLKKTGASMTRYSQSMDGSSGMTLGHKRQGSHFELRDDNIELDVNYYLETVTALCKLMECEVKLMENIINKCHWSVIFERVYQAALDMVITEGENIAIRAKKCAGKQDFSSTLLLFVIHQRLTVVKPEMENILEGCQANIRAKLESLTAILVNTGRRALDDFLDSIKNDQDRQMPKDGTVHELTSNAMIFLEQLKDYAESVGSMLATIGITDQPNYDKAIMAVARYMVKVLSTLGLTLNNKSDWYSEPYLKSIFRLNNLHYIWKTLQRTGAADMAKLYMKDLEVHYNDLILEQKRIYSQSWSRVLHYILEVDRPLQTSLAASGVKLKDKDRQNIKDKFTGFNKEMEDIYKIQKGYAIPDSELRESLKRENKDFIMPKYDAFYTKYVNVNFAKYKEKYIKYTPKAVSGMIDSFFDVAA